MGTKKSPQSSAAIKDSSKRSSRRNRSRIKPQMHQRRIINKKKAKMSLHFKGAKAPRFKPLAKLFNHGGMAYGSRSILHTIHNDYQLRRKFLRRGIRSKKGVEEALLELLFQCRNLKDWDSGGDNLVDVFRLIKGRVKWAANCSVDLVMQLFFALLRARLECPRNLRENACKVALRVDKVISVSVLKATDPFFSDPALSPSKDSFRVMVRPEYLFLNVVLMFTLVFGDFRANLRPCSTSTALTTSLPNTRSTPTWCCRFTMPFETCPEKPRCLPPPCLARCFFRQSAVTAIKTFNTTTWAT